MLPEPWAEGMPSFLLSTLNICTSPFIAEKWENESQKRGQKEWKNRKVGVMCGSLETDSQRSRGLTTAVTTCSWLTGVWVMTSQSQTEEVVTGSHFSLWTTGFRRVLEEAQSLSLVVRHSPGSREFLQIHGHTVTLLTLSGTQDKQQSKWDNPRWMWEEDLHGRRSWQKCKRD